MAWKPGDPRRAAGSGSVVYERGRGRWLAQLKVDGETHRRTAPDQETAFAHLVQLVSKHGQGLSLRGQYTVAGYLSEYLTTARLRPTTRANYEGYARRYITPALGSRRLDQLAAPHVRRLLHNLGERGLAPRTVRQTRAILSGMLQQALADGLIERNTARLVKAPELVNVERARLSLEEARALREVLRGDPLEALYVLAMTLGLRVGELRGLRWQDVELEAGVLRVQQTAQWIKPLGQPGQWVFGPPKTPRSRRTLPLAPELAELLRAHRSRQAAAHVKSGLRPARRLVFADAAGAPLADHVLRLGLRRHLKAVWARAAEERAQLAATRAGAAADEVPEARAVSFHDLRHIAASLMHAEGLTPRTVQDVLGHSSYLTTMNIYTHIPAAELARTLAGAGRWLEAEAHPEAHLARLAVPAGVVSPADSVSDVLVSGPVAQR